jgi:hypothetical protein
MHSNVLGVEEEGRRAIVPVMQCEGDLTCISCFGDRRGHGPKNTGSMSKPRQGTKYSLEPPERNELCDTSVETHLKHLPQKLQDHTFVFFEATKLLLPSSSNSKLAQSLSL